VAVSGPEGLGAFLAAILQPPVQDGPPWVHTVRPPEPVEELEEGEDGEMVLAARIPLRPAFTLEQRPVFSGCLAYMEEQ
jgi:hypothetical protein